MRTVQLVWDDSTVATVLYSCGVSRTIKCLHEGAQATHGAVQTEYTCLSVIGRYSTKAYPPGASTNRVFTALLYIEPKL